MKTIIMPPQEKRRKHVAYMFFAVAFLSLSCFAYLNLCTENTLMIAEYMGDISYSDFRIEEIVLPDLHFFENSFQRIMELIFTRA
ncbi:hypothetical protein [Portibacter lacus]|uniref:Uncharacterized protein n=1 Tax=Portibacter lacus TaxID=1099794 RepID=A0AA37SR74_9BACT|nr:hypothetical protein [Portibacter lacus]GLR18442.1 hypothetical protein GCM10007940_30580 [Portibacter lacus]